MAKSFGLISRDRLQNLHEKYWKKHEFCFHVHDLMVRSLAEVEEAQLSFVKINLKNDAQAAVFKTLKGEGLVSFLESEGFTEEVQKMLTNQVSMAVFSDMLHFVYEALRMLEKRKFSVALSLLRKPLKENLLFLSWLCADEDDFYASFSDPTGLMNSRVLKRNKRLAIFEGAVEMTDMKEMFNAEVIHDTIWDKSVDGNLAILFDKATHLVTTMGDQMKTEAQNFNFVFKKSTQDDIYEAIYHKLAYLLIYGLNVQFVLYERMGFDIKKFRKWSKLSLWGAYEPLFVKGKPKFYGAVKKAFRGSEFFTCPHCDQEIKLMKDDVADFFVMQSVTCTKCKRQFQFPLFWIMSKTNLDFS